MPRLAKPLTELTIRAAKPNEKPYKLFDGRGLYLEVFPHGSKLWRLKYRFCRKDKRIALGAWPEVSLASARQQREQARALLAEGKDPAAIKRAKKAKSLALAHNTFERIAREWDAKHLATKSPGHREKVIRRLEKYAFPLFGKRPIDEIEAPLILACVRPLEACGKIETAHRTLQAIGQVIRYAIATGRATYDPTQALRQALPPANPKHMPAPTDQAKVGELLRAMEAFKGSFVVYAALRLLPYLFVRPRELRRMRWEELEGIEENSFHYPAWRFVASKTQTEHLVPLSRQAVAILRELKPITGHLAGGWVFPNGRTSLRPISDAAINAAYRRLGIDTKTEITAHGWRAVARTLLHEKLGFPPDVIEHQLGHTVPDRLGRAYNRTKFLEQRRDMMQAWADYLDALREGKQ